MALLRLGLSSSSSLRLLMEFLDLASLLRKVEMDNELLNLYGSDAEMLAVVHSYNMNPTVENHCERMDAGAGTS